MSWRASACWRRRLGAGEVLASLWPVADRSTSLLMLNVYRAFDTSRCPPRGPCNRAARLLRGEPRFAPYAHPFYWAPFILMSDGSTGI